MWPIIGIRIGLGGSLGPGRVLVNRNWISLIEAMQMSSTTAYCRSATAMID